MKTRSYLSLGLLACITSTFAQTTPPAPSSPWTFDFGPRYWLSTGKFRLNLFNPSHQPASRLTYDDWTGNSAEGFWQLQHENGLFLKGYFGGGSMSGGQFIDEDFPPGIVPYSKTHSIQQDGALDYFSADLGYRFLKQDNGSLGAFIGYHYWNQQYHAFGAEQLAGNASIFGVVPPIFGHAPNSVNVHALDMTWNTLRLGVMGEYTLSDKMNLSTDIAYTRSNLALNDYHYLRPDIRGVFEDGAGNGVQLDAILNYQLSNDLSIGVGGRWWYVTTSGLSHFEQTYASGAPEPENVTQNTYGLLIQSRYVFHDNPVDKDGFRDQTLQWDGFYLGPNMGYGTNPTNVHFSALSSAIQTAQFNYNTPPKTLNLQNQGYVGGGTAGYQRTVDRFVLGIEGDIDYSQISGANASSPNQVGITTSLSNQINTLATLRARIGKPLLDDFLPYVTAGGAFAKATLSLDMREPGVNCPHNLICASSKTSQTLSGFTAGTGMEYAVSHKLSFKAEYQYINLGTISTNTRGDSVLGPISVQSMGALAINNVKLGVNYHI